MHLAFSSRRDRHHRSLGQSLVELALVLPIILLIVMMALDFGRAFYSWVSITNATRVGANYLAANPSDPYPTALVQAEAQGTNAICTTMSGSATFTDGPDAGTSNKNLGDSVSVSISCNFRILTPVIGAVLSNAVTMQAASTFPIRVGAQQ